jgi:hypothetical protein
MRLRIQGWVGISTWFLCAVSATMNRRSGYFPTLDGWRALAVFSVVLCHDYLYTLGPLNHRKCKVIKQEQLRQVRK